MSDSSVHDDVDTSFEPNNNGKGFTLAHLNVRSLKKKIPEVEALIHKHNLDVLTLSETWLSSQIQDTIVALQDYNLYRHDRVARPAQSRGGRVATYILSHLHTNFEKYDYLNFSNLAIESQVLLTSKANHKANIIVNIYRPPAGDKDVFESHIVHILQSIVSERYADLYILGDFNLDHSPSNKSPFTAKLESLINLYGFSQVIKGYTRQTITTKSLIDVLYAKTTKKIFLSVLKLSISNHYLISARIILGYNTDPQSSFLGRSYRNYNFNIAQTYYSSLDLDYIYQFNDVNLVWKALKDRMIA